MSLYSFGINAVGGAVGAMAVRGGVGALIFPGRIKDEINTAATEINTIHDSITNAYQTKKINSDFYNGWVAFYKEFRDFANAHQTFLSNHSVSTYDKTLEYRKRAEGWRDQLAAVAKTQVPGPKAIIQQQSDTFLPAGTDVNKLLTTVKWVGGGILAFWAYNEFVKPAIGAGRAAKAAFPFRKG